MNSVLRKSLILLCAVVLTSACLAAPLGSSVRPAIPSEVQQLICVDYRAFRNSETAMALKAQVLPDNLKQFETALRGAGINPDRDVDELTFISYRNPKHALEVVGAAQGVFPTKTVLAKLKLHKIRPVKYRDADIYPMSSGMEMTFLDDTTLLFGDGGAVRGSLDARDGYVTTLDSNPDIANLIGDVEGGVGVERSRPERYAEHAALRAGRCLAACRLRNPQETHSWLALYHEFSERSESGFRRHDLGLSDGSYSVIVREGRCSLPKNDGQRGREVRPGRGFREL